MSSTPPFNVDALVRIDVTTLTAHDLERAVRQLIDFPLEDVDVEIVVAPRQHIPYSVEAVRRHARTKGITVVCSDPLTGLRWKRALLEGIRIP